MMEHPPLERKRTMTVSREIWGELQIEFQLISIISPAFLKKDGIMEPVVTFSEEISPA